MDTIASLRDWDEKIVTDLMSVQTNQGVIGWETPTRTSRAHYLQTTF